MRSTALTDDDLVSGEDVFVAATGVTSGARRRRTSAAGVETELRDAPRPGQCGALRPTIHRRS